MIQGSDWTILQEGKVLSSTDDDVITMEILGNCSIQQGKTVNQNTHRCVGEGLGNCHQMCINPRVHFNCLHPAKSMDLEMVGNQPTNQKAPSSLACFFLNYFVTVVSKATNWCTGSLSL